MEHLFNGLIEKTKTDKKGLLMLKNTAVRCQQFELALQLRELEKEYFPETEEEKEAKKVAKDLNLLFRMVDLTVPEDVCWLINEALKAYKKGKGNLSLRDASKLAAKREELFKDII